MVRGKGTGFVAVEDFLEDIVIPGEDLSTALNGDLVEIEFLPAVKGRRQEGKVVRIVETAHSEFIGAVKTKEIDGKKEYYFSPDNFRIHVRPTLPEATEADLDMKVVIKIKSWDSPKEAPIGEITETIGKVGDHETEMQAIIRGGGFSENFPEEISDAAHELYTNKEQIFADAINDPKRRDIRSMTTMTIDPADAKDFDDALSFEKLENGNLQVGIHIADVSHYVKDGDVIDMEARERGTSIYLVDRVIPMLPEVLSNDLCSLRPNEDRLAFSAVFEVTQQGEVKDEWFGQTVIHSDKRFSYEEAQEVLDNQSGEYLEELNGMMALGRIFRKQRTKNGAIAFEQPEVKFELDETGKPIKAVTKIRIETMLMIEDFMLMANQRVPAKIHSLSKERGNDPAFIYRVHDLPNPDKIEELSIFVHAMGYEFKTEAGVATARDINKLLNDVEGKPEENLIKVATIRSMAKAIYSTKNIGHFGLAFEFYTQFTSPIRRYPDLMAHRMLRKYLDKVAIGPQEKSKNEKLAAQSSEREMVAVKAERDSIKYKQVEYMSDKVDQEFDGIITGVADWGIYVAEKESMSEGMVKLSSMKGDFFAHQSDKYRVKGEKTGTAYSLGDEVRIKLVRADLEERQLDFVLVA